MKKQGKITFPMVHYSSVTEYKDEVDEMSKNSGLIF